jgi:hypothetical protein
MKSTVDKNGKTVRVGDKILVHEIDKRITEYLPEDELESLNSFIGNTYKVNHLNTDGSMVVTKEWKDEGCDEIMGHDIAIFPVGAELVGG